jgi:hypothetical protein
MSSWEDSEMGFNDRWQTVAWICFVQDRLGIGSREYCN